MPSTFKIVYQNTPYNYTAPQALIIEADDRESALVTAYDYLTRKGHAISVDSVAYDLNGIAPHVEPKLDWEKVKSLGWPTRFTSGDTHIRSITEHAVKATGRVITNS